LADSFSFTYKALQVIINGRVPGKKNFLIKHLTFYIFIQPDQAEAGSAEEQPARNNPVADEVIRFTGLGKSQTFFTELLLKPDT
jgi:hypothetical protein